MILYLLLACNDKSVELPETGFWETGASTDPSLLPEDHPVNVLFDPTFLRTLNVAVSPLWDASAPAHMAAISDGLNATDTNEFGNHPVQVLSQSVAGGSYEVDGVAHKSSMIYAIVTSDLSVAAPSIVDMREGASLLIDLSTVGWPAGEPSSYTMAYAVYDVANGDTAATFGITGFGNPSSQVLEMYTFDDAEGTDEDGTAITYIGTDGELHTQTFAGVTSLPDVLSAFSILTGSDSDSVVNGIYSVTDDQFRQ